MVTIFTLSDHGAIKRRPQVLLRYISKLPTEHHYDYYTFSYSVRDGVSIFNNLFVLFLFPNWFPKNG